MGESGVGTRGGGVAHRGRLLESDVDTASRGVFDGLLGLVVEAIALQAVAERSQGGEMGAGARDPPVRQDDVAAVHAADNGGRHRVGRGEMGEGCACVCVRL